MSARILHLGDDECRRMSVLEEAGYAVEGYGSVLNLTSALGNGQAADLVLVSEGRREPKLEDIQLIREHSDAPILLFQSTVCGCDESAFDGVIPALTPPEVWLERVAAMIRQRAHPSAEARALWGEAAALREDSAAIRSRRQAAIHELRKNEASARGKKDQRPVAGGKEPQA
jgi:hypothetical protein